MYWCVLQWTKFRPETFADKERFCNRSTIVSFVVVSLLCHLLLCHFFFKPLFPTLKEKCWNEDCFYYCSQRNNVVVLFETLKVQSFTPVTSAYHEKSGETPHFQSPSTHACRRWKYTCDTHACSGGIGQYKSTKCAYTSAYVPPHAFVYTCICIHIHRHTYIHIHSYANTRIHAYKHTRTHIHVHAHPHTDRKSQQQRLNASSHTIDAHTHRYTYACIYAYICIYTYVHILQRMCRRCVCWCQRNICHV